MRQPRRRWLEGTMQQQLSAVLGAVILASAGLAGLMSLRDHPATRARAAEL